ncbi:efflux RND transporter periplasmic adaptor subunit [Clostridium sp. P21]|uniref:Efflux RND transporter periplasmic adaptor subunit n=1 Tax=Clostridium muellerianum TaxID=2716538 RepID=A0A7Y0EEX4_9CLOT|nr:efflux RND transporter periplasmic adaptor subunit [Clostridium muellerianum]NMM62229.1 efflux RND transporter periplasmic adaptor subunit [Clostridium muellerianum]
MKKIKKIAAFAVIILVVIGAIVVKNKMTSTGKNTGNAVKVNKTAVEVKIAKMVEKNTRDIYKATLEAYQQGMITSKISAKVISVTIENGQYVNSGDAIVTLDDTDIQNNLKSAQAQLKINEQQLNSTEQQLNSAQITMQKLQINLDDSQRNYDRQKTLFESGAISKSDFEAAETRLNNSKADYNSGNANIKITKVSIETSKASIEAQKVNIEKFKNDLSNVVIKAPISGVISDKAINVGQMVSPGTVLAKVNDTSSIYATIQVPQEKISDTKIGQSATVTVGGSDRVFHGKVQNIDLSADVASRVFNCKIKIDNNDKALYPGVYTKTELLSLEKTQVITTPVNVLVGNEGNYSVFINDNGKAKKQKVTIGETYDNKVEISSGIKDGDQIICTNTGTLQDGDEIEVTSSGNDDLSQTNSIQKDDLLQEGSK